MSMNIKYLEILITEFIEMGSDIKQHKPKWSLTEALDQVVLSNLPSGSRVSL
jgi:hypothetical protein